MFLENSCRSLQGAEYSAPARLLSLHTYLSLLSLKKKKKKTGRESLLHEIPGSFVSVRRPEGNEQSLDLLQWHTREYPEGICPPPTPLPSWDGEATGGHGDIYSCKVGRYVQNRWSHSCHVKQVILTPSGLESPGLRNAFLLNGSHCLLWLRGL